MNDLIFLVTVPPHETSPLGIKAHQYPDETHRTGRGAPWVISCEVNSVTYSATSRSGAPYALARVLTQAGVPDQPMTVVSQGFEGETRYNSIHKLAGYTIVENATHPVHLARWQPYGGKPSPAGG